MFSAEKLVAVWQLQELMVLVEVQAKADMVIKTNQRKNTGTEALATNRQTQMGNLVKLALSSSHILVKVVFA